MWQNNVESNQIFCRCVFMHIEDGMTNDMPEDEEMENREGWRPRELNKICCLEHMLLNFRSRGYISKHNMYWMLF